MPPWCPLDGLCHTTAKEIQGPQSQGRSRSPWVGGLVGGLSAPRSHMLPGRRLQAAIPLFFLSSPCHLSVPAGLCLSPTPGSAAGARTVPASLVVASDPASPAQKAPVFLQGKYPTPRPSVTPALQPAHSRCPPPKMLLGFTWNKPAF